MIFRRLIGRLLAVCVIVGLVAAPLVTPAAAERLPVGGMSDMAAMPLALEVPAASPTHPRPDRAAAIGFLVR